MRYLRYAFLALVALVLIIMAVANRDMVTLSLLPEDIAGRAGFNFSYQLPQFIIIFLSIALGLLIGFVWEWFREHKLRAEARSVVREKTQLERQIKGMKRKASEGKDEVLALLDDAAKA
ncbi:MAG: LapA family protein [Litoreibacter sp.]